MHRLAFLAFCALAGCGLVVSGLGAPGTDGGIDGATTIDGAPNSDSATLSDGESVDGGKDVVVDSGMDVSEPVLPASNPGFVSCTFNPCNTAAAQFCCIGKGTCEGNPSACGKYKEIHCDEPLDCAGLRCCLGRNSNEQDNASFRCAADCATVSGYQVCRTHLDCVGTSSPTCIAVTCLGRTVGTCGGKLPPQCADGG